MSEQVAALSRFEYKARDTNGGRFRTGTVRAADAAAAERFLRGNGLAVLDLAESGRGLNREIRLRRSRVKRADLAHTVRQVATMTAAGMPLVRVLAAAAEQTSSQPMRAALQQLGTRVRSGQELSEGMRANPGVFPPMLADMLEAGEASGNVPATLDRAAAVIERQVALQRKVAAVMVYPAVVMGMAVVLLVALLVFVVPVFRGMYEQMGGELPLPTRILSGISQAAVVWLPLAVLAGAGAALAWRRVRSQPGAQRVKDRLIGRVPVLGSISRKVAVARFARNMSAMVRSGVPQLRALGICAQAAGNTFVADGLRDAAAQVRQGEPMSVALARHSVFPPVLVQMIGVGEETGQLDALLAQAATAYDREVETATEAAMSLIEPVMVVGIGALIGTAVIALYLPIFQIYDLIH